MHSPNLGLALAIAACVAGGPQAVLAADVPADTFCPRAVPKLIAFKEAGAGTDIAKISAAARDAAYEYQLCISEATTRTYDEPRINYDRVRAAQFLVVEGRALAANGDAKGATQALHDGRALADFVAKWAPMAQTFAQSNNGSGSSDVRSTDHNGSRYQEAAKLIVTAADLELVKLNAPAPQAPAKP